LNAKYEPTWSTEFSLALGAEKVPDAKTLARIEWAIGPEVFQKVHDRIIGILREKKVVEGRKMRIDTTVTNTNIHYPPTAVCLGDGVRVLTRTLLNGSATGAAA
jgi:transposase, IS5 family